MKNYTITITATYALHIRAGDEDTAYNEAADRFYESTLGNHCTALHVDVEEEIESGSES